LQRGKVLLLEAPHMTTILDALAKALPDKSQKWAEWTALLAKEGIEKVSDMRGFKEQDFAALQIPAVLRVTLRELAAQNIGPPEYDEKEATPPASAVSAPAVAGVATPPPGAARPGGPRTSRESGPEHRPWEWYLLEGIKADNPALLDKANTYPEINWDVTVQPFFGKLAATEAFYFQLDTFGLLWKIGDTPTQLANRNNRKAAALRILTLKGHAAGP